MVVCTLSVYKYCFVSQLKILKILTATYCVTVYILKFIVINKLIVINNNVIFTAELELWHFHVAAIQYNFPSRPQIKDFLLSTEFNCEEDNYRLSLQREPPANRSQSAS